jgi:Protein of unknown function (DUF1566)
METIINHETGEKFEVASKDFPHKMNWEQARDECNGQGNSWRLPTREELEIIHHDMYRKDKGNFKDKKNKDYYWTSSKSPDDFRLTFAFFDGSIYIDAESTLNSVRAVRDL